MFEISLDDAKKCVFLTLSGVVDKAESEKLVSELKDALRKAGTDYVCVSDLSKFKMRPDDAKWLLQVQELFTRAGISEVIRIGDPKYHELLEKSGQKIGYTGTLVADIEAANQLLSKRN